MFSGVKPGDKRCPAELPGNMEILTGGLLPGGWYDRNNSDARSSMGHLEGTRLGLRTWN